jgi:hypothetical protein
MSMRRFLHGRPQCRYYTGLLANPWATTGYRQVWPSDILRLLRAVSESWFWSSLPRSRCTLDRNLALAEFPDGILHLVSRPKNCGSMVFLPAEGETVESYDAVLPACAVMPSCFVNIAVTSVNVPPLFGFRCGVQLALGSVSVPTRLYGGHLLPSVAISSSFV